jgi:hypothetical protein
MARRVEATKQKLVGGCLEVLRNLECCDVRFEPPEAGKPSDGLLRLSGPKWTISYAVQAKQPLTGASAEMLLHGLQVLPLQRPPTLFFTDYVHADLAERFRKHHIEFVDVAGNAYLHQSSLYVFVVGRKRLHTPERPTRVFQVTGLKLIFLLLKTPDAINWNYRDLARAAGIALGGVGWLLRDLRALGFVHLVGKRQRRLVKRRELLERWEVGYAERLRAKLFHQQFRLAENRTFDLLLDRIRDLADIDAILVGGELGASLLLDTLRPERATLHVLGEPLKIITQLRLIPDPGGPIDVLHGFGSCNDWKQAHPKGCKLADPLFIHAELLLHHSERLRQIAEDIYKRYLLERIGSLMARLNTNSRAHFC